MLREVTQPGLTLRTVSVFDQWGHRIVEYDSASGTLLREYIWLGDRPIAVIEDGDIFYIHVDHISRPVMATDATGAVIWSATYTPFGGIHSVNVDTGALTAQELRFPGQWFQAETGFHQNWHRTYDATLGRYLEPDPLGLIDGPSVYGYALQNPGRFVDPTGRALPLAAMAGGALLGGSVGAVNGYLVSGCWQGALLGGFAGAAAGALSASGALGSFSGPAGAGAASAIGMLIGNKLCIRPCETRPSNWELATSAKFFITIGAAAAGAAAGGLLGGPGSLSGRAAAGKPPTIRGAIEEALPAALAGAWEWVIWR